MIHPIKSAQAHFQNWKSANYEKSKCGRRIAALQNIHTGERCFFIGNGPSLRGEDLTRLYKGNEVCFGFNRIYHIFDQTEWRPTYYISQDEKMLAGSREEVSNTEMGVKFIPIQMRWYHQIDIKDAEWFSLKTGREEDGRPLEFSDEPQKVIYNSTTCMYTAAQLAAFMGFTRIYMIGVDHSFRISRNNRGEIVIDNTVEDYFTHRYNEDRDELYVPNTEKSTLTYLAMKEQCSKRNISVFNATRGGKLEVFERVDFDSLFE